MGKNLKMISAAAVVAMALFLAGALGPRDTSARSPEPSATGVDLDGVASPVGAGVDLDATIARLERLQAENPDPQITADLGLAYLQQAKATDNPELLSVARDRFADALERDQENFSALVGSALVANSFHRFDDMEILARRAIEVNPFSALAHGILGDSFVYRDRLDEARAALQEMLDRGPDMPGYTRVSYLYEQLGKERQARTFMRQALEASIAPEDIAWTSYHLGVLQLAGGDRTGAERSFTLGLERAPDSAYPHAGMALLAFDRRDLPEAVRLMERAAALRPSLEFLAPLAELHAVSGSAAASERAYERAARLEESYLAAGALADPELVIFFTDAGQVEDALALARRLYDEAGPSVATDEAMGWSLTASGEARKGLRFLQRSIAAGGDSHTHYFAAIASLELGRSGAARGHLERALDIDPNFSFRYAIDAERLLAELS